MSALYELSLELTHVPNVVYVVNWCINTKSLKVLKGSPSPCHLTILAEQMRPTADVAYQLYEQQNKQKATSNEMAFVLGQYVKRSQR